MRRGWRFMQHFTIARSSQFEKNNGKNWKRTLLVRKTATRRAWPIEARSQALLCNPPSWFRKSKVHIEHTGKRN
jgi:hypothetical protein